MIGIGRVALGVIMAGWLADQLARPDSDVEAGIEAYEAGQLDVALEHFESAISRHGDQPELSYDRGLVRLAQEEPTEARRAFERGSETEDLEVRASAFYERGNVAFDTEDWDAAIEAYIECLKARPDHGNAKWNLELALLRKEQDEEDDDSSSSDSGGEDSGGSDSGGEDSGGSDSGGEDSGGSDSGGEDSGGEDSGGEDSGGEDSGGEDSGGEDSGGEDSGGEEPPETGGEEPPPPSQQPVDEMDLQRALDELDAQDEFPLDKLGGGMRPPTEDW